ncbi:MAG: efflux RND transporter periplasmic adaptor subunit [Phycisphaerales bacterium]|nr:efflux RND transporter periplasmic adaptor subunit [Phycisphaerales bacterium]
MILRLVMMLIVCLTWSGCDDRSSTDHDHEEAPATADGPSNRIAAPSAVRSNLGITFVVAERRQIRSTIRVPGRFEYIPTARRSYGPMLPGRVELLVSQFDEVKAGQPLFRLDSPDWREMQQTLAEASASIARFETRLESSHPLRQAHDRHESSLDESIAVWEERIGQLEVVRQAGGGRVEELANARAALAAARAELANVQEKKAELVADESEARAGLDAARSRRSYLLDAASAILGVARADLEAGTDGVAAWEAISSIEVRATGPGVVEEIALVDGSWAEPQSPVLTVTRPERLRFRASGLQSDLGVLRSGLEATIVPPSPTRAGRSVSIDETMRGTVRLGLSGDAIDRTIDLFVEPEHLLPWARAGVSAQLEIVTSASERAELSVPLAAVQRDGLEPILFRRDASDPDTVIRMVADLGADDGRWVEVRSGLGDGDEVVLDGAFQLMLASSGSMQKGGHFHADGTYHEGED